MRPDMSTQLLRDLYTEAARFHMQRPWETLSNNEPLEVKLPTGVRVFVRVAGHTAYDGRGLYFYRSLADLRAADRGGRCEFEALMFHNAVHTSFEALDHIVELGLELE